MGLFSFLLLFFPDYTVSGFNYLSFGSTSATSLKISSQPPLEGFCGLEPQVKQKVWSLASLKYGFGATSHWGE